MLLGIALIQFSKELNNVYTVLGRTGLWRMFHYNRWNLDVRKSTSQRDEKRGKRGGMELPRKRSFLL